jgi:hypothetical protein
MIHIDINQSEGIAVLKPAEMTRLSETDFREITDRIDAYLENHDYLQGLVIVTEHFPGWDSLQAFASHIKLIKDHHKRIKKVALVSDSPLLTAAPHLVDHFVGAKIRHFGLDQIEEAKTWAAQPDQPSGRFVVLEGYPDDVVAIRAEGIITRDDYEKTLIPLLEEKIKSQGKIKMLYWCGEEFKGFSAGAMWDDARFGLMHLSDLAGVAMVTDVEWLRMSVKMFSPLMPVPVQVFHNAEIEDAKQWICQL